MKFYCPSCQKEYEVEPSETITTKSGRVAYKANCPVCKTDMAEFVPGEKREVKKEEGQHDHAVDVPQPIVDKAAELPEVNDGDKPSDEVKKELKVAEGNNDDGGEEVESVEEENVEVGKVSE